MTGHRRSPARPAVVGLALATVCVLAPVLRTSFLGDDAFNSYIDGWIAAHHAGVPAAIAASFEEWDVGRGRFLPLLQVLNVLQFHAFHSPLPLKLLQVAAVVLDVVTFYAVVVELGGDWARAAVTSVVAILALQLRFAYDAITQYNLHLPLSTEAALLCVFFVSRYARTRRLLVLLAAALCFAAATLLYEIFAPLALAIPFILRSRGCSLRQVLFASSPFALLIGVEAAADVAIRIAAPVPATSAYAPRLDGRVFATIANQLIATIPGSYVAFDPQAVFRRAGSRWWLGASAAGALAAVTLGAIVAAAVARVRALDRSATPFLAVGLCFLLGPAVLVSFSPFYQSAIVPGAPYIPVFAQGFGLAFCCAAIPWPRAQDRVPAVAARCVAVLTAFAAYALAEANALSVAHFGAWKYPRDTIVGGLIAGTGRELRDGATLYVDRSYIVNDRFEPGSTWNNRYFYRLWTGRDLTIRSDDALRGGAREHAAFDLRSRYDDPDRGVVIVSRLDGEPGPHVADALIFERHSDAGPAARPAYVFENVATRDFQTIDSGPGWNLFRFRPRCKSLSIDVLANDAPTRGLVSFGPGFSVEENDALTRWHWAASSAELTISNPDRTALAVRLAGRLNTAAPAKGTLAVIAPGGVRDLALSAHDTPIALALAIPAHGVARIRFIAHAPNVAIAGDSRDLRFRLVDPRLIDSGGCASADARER